MTSMIRNAFLFSVELSASHTGIFWASRHNVFLYGYQHFLLEYWNLTVKEEPASIDACTMDLCAGNRKRPFMFGDFINRYTWAYNIGAWSCRLNRITVTGISFGSFMLVHWLYFFRLNGGWNEDSVRTREEIDRWTAQVEPATRPMKRMR